MQRTALLASIRRALGAYGSTAAASFSHAYAALSLYRVISKLGLTRWKRAGAWVRISFARGMPSLSREMVDTARLNFKYFAMENNGLNGNLRFN
jgi:hypothetical protein